MLTHGDRVNPHILTAHHRGRITTVSCRCGQQASMPTGTEGDWMRRHRIATGQMGRYLR